MTRVLLITDTERVQRIFESLEKKGVLQLRTAATLTQGDLEMAASPPEITFVQSRISGFSGEIMLRHLKKTLPDGAKIILLAGDADAVAQAKKHGRPFLDLSAGDEALADAVSREIGRSLPEKAIPGETSHPAKLKDAVGVTSLVLEEREKQVEPVAAEPPAGSPALETEKPVAKELSDDVPMGGGGGTESFDRIMQRASTKGGSSVSGPLDVEAPVDIGTPLSASAEGSGRTGRPGREGMAVPVQVSEFSRGETLADAMLRAEKKKRPNWVPLLALALLCIPLFSYLAGKKTAPQHSLLAPAGFSRPNQRLTKASAPATPRAPAAITKPSPTKAPGMPPVAQPEAKQTAKLAVKPAPVAKPVAQAGLRELPPFITDVRPDAAYGKTHPGWLRYTGKKTEYKLFREAGLYRALQVMALGGETISDQLFKRVLLEFAGADSYHMEFTEKKGDYLLEQCVTKSAVALTIYRKKNDLRMKAIVLYYR